MAKRRWYLQPLHKQCTSGSLLLVDVFASLAACLDLGEVHLRRPRRCGRCIGLAGGSQPGGRAGTNLPTDRHKPVVSLLSL